MITSWFNEVPNWSRWRTRDSSNETIDDDDDDEDEEEEEEGAGLEGEELLLRSSVVEPFKLLILSDFLKAWLTSFPIEKNLFLSTDPGKFLQLLHLHRSEQVIPSWKHSQYFLRQFDFLQWHPLWWSATSAAAAWSVDDDTTFVAAKDNIFDRNALGFLSTVEMTANLRVFSFS